MAQYENLKDYFQNEHKQLIQDAISHHLNDDMQLTEPVIRSLVCTDDDECFNAEFEIGVSVNAVDVEETDALKFIITVRGNIEQRFKDIHVMSVRNINGDSFPDDNLLSQFILPDITEGEAERIGNDLYNFYSKYGYFENYKLSIPHLVTEGMIHFALLPNNCLGRVILSESDVEIIQNVQTEFGLKTAVCTIRAAHGTILVNYENYAKKLDGGLRITVAHELVHTLFHGRFLKVLQLLGEEKVDMHPSTENVALDETMSHIQKALCISEWQADVLAMRLAIPSATADTVMCDITADPSTHYENIGDRMQACVIRFAKVYGVSCYVAKDRLRQLGYDDVDGTFMIVDGCIYQPFSFPRGTLIENETFAINRDNYERLRRENKDFAELINSGRYVYLGYVVCRLDAEYIDVVSDEDDIRLVLSEYARENASKCLLKFRLRNEKTSNSSYYYNAFYLNKIPEYNEIVTESFELCEEDTGLNSKTVELIKEYNDTMGMLNSSKLKKSLANTVVYYMQKKNIDDKELKERTGLSLTAIEKIYKGKTKNVNKKNVMALCIGLELESEECYDMFEKAGHNVREEDTMQNRAYRFLFSCTQSGLEECNKILRHFNQEELPDHKKKSCETEK